ncbi:MAG: N-acetylmuramoyl-L-alanine amidase [Bacteroides sp.]|nr:N-acetylmuramoyl-L-alanine amidase [Bacteroides sp.]
MKRGKLHIIYIVACIGMLLACAFPLQVEAKDFVLVIDAGHGGNDPGAVGKISKEKDINLKVALKVGKMIEDNCKDVKVIYTRKRDVFVTLNRRAQIANEAKADLFISIHTNAVAKNKTVKGTSTWTLGLAKSDDNLEVAKRENAVILYEDDYQTHYEGFNPNSAESYIIFEFMQDQYMSQSVRLASLVQNEFKQTGHRIDRGVHQAGFLVLKASAMPSILVELGFISTPEEERYLNTENGVNTLSKSIYQAFLTYKNEQSVALANEAEPATKPNNKPASKQTTTTAPKKEKAKVANNNNETVFKLQLFSTSKPLDKNDKRLKGLKNVSYYQEGGLYKYTCGDSGNYDEVVRTKQQLASQYKGSFIVAFKNGKKIDVKEAVNEFNKNKKKR